MAKKATATAAVGQFLKSSLPTKIDEGDDEGVEKDVKEVIAERQVTECLPEEEGK